MKSSLEDIHFVLFFFLEGTSLEGAQTVLKMFINANYNVLINQVMIAIMEKQQI